MELITVEDLGHGVRAHVRALLIAAKAADELRGEEIARLRAAGRRIVTGGRFAAPDEASDWRIADWETGETLAAGHGTLDDMAAATALANPAGTWHHIDTVELPDADVPPQHGIPSSLAAFLTRWCDEAMPDDLERVTGWDAEKVKRHLDLPHSE